MGKDKVACRQQLMIVMAYAVCRVFYPFGQISKFSLKWLDKKLELNPKPFPIFF